MLVNKEENQPPRPPSSYPPQEGTLRACRLYPLLLSTPETHALLLLPPCSSPLSSSSSPPLVSFLGGRGRSNFEVNVIFLEMEDCLGLSLAPQALERPFTAGTLPYPHQRLSNKWQWTRKTRASAILGEKGTRFSPIFGGKSAIILGRVGDCHL